MFCVSHLLLDNVSTHRLSLGRGVGGGCCCFCLEVSDTADQEPRAELTALSTCGSLLCGGPGTA